MVSITTAILLTDGASLQHSLEMKSEPGLSFSGTVSSAKLFLFVTHEKDALIK